MEWQRGRAKQVRAATWLSERSSKYFNNPPFGPGFLFDADPNSGVSVYDSTRCQGLSGWLVFGGTSVSSPSLSGIVNQAGGGSSTVSELTTIYANRTNTSDFRDITSGSAGSFSAAPGWDFVTGVGSDLGLNGK